MTDNRGGLTDFMRVNGKRAASRPPVSFVGGLRARSADLRAQDPALPEVSDREKTA